jgi:hypothetical protein
MQIDVKDRNAEICKLYESGLSSLKIGKKYGLCYQRVMQIVKRKEYNALRARYRQAMKDAD